MRRTFQTSRTLIKKLKMERDMRPTKSLAQHSLGLHAHALDAVDDDERTVGDAQSGGDLGREVNVAGRVCKPEGSATQALAAYRGGCQNPVHRTGRGPRALRR